MSCHKSTSMVLCRMGHLVMTLFILTAAICGSTQARTTEDDDFLLVSATEFWRVFAKVPNCSSDSPTIELRAKAFDLGPLLDQNEAHRMVILTLRQFIHVEEHPCSKKRIINVDLAISFRGQQRATFGLQLQWLGNAYARNRFHTVRYFRGADSMSMPRHSKLTQFVTNLAAGAYLLPGVEKNRNNVPNLRVSGSREDQGLTHDKEKADVSRMQRDLDNITAADELEAEQIEWLQFIMKLYTDTPDGELRDTARFKQLSATNASAALNYFYAVDGCNVTLPWLAKDRPEGVAEGEQKALTDEQRACLKRSDLKKFALYKFYVEAIRANGWSVDGDTLAVSQSAAPTSQAIQPVLHDLLVRAVTTRHPVRDMLIAQGGKLADAECDSSVCTVNGGLGKLRWLVIGDPTCERLDKKPEPSWFNWSSVETSPRWNCRFRWRMDLQVDVRPLGLPNIPGDWRQGMLDGLTRAAIADGEMVLELKDGKWASISGVLKGHEGQIAKW